MRTAWGRRFTRWVGNLCHLVQVREEDSLRLVREVGVRAPLRLTADVAFLNKVASPQRVDEILAAEGFEKGRPILGVNVTRYGAQWMGANAGTEAWLSSVAEAADAVVEDGGAQVAVCATQTMDVPTAQRLIRRLRRPERVRLMASGDYGHREMMGVMGRCELFVGMRLHSLILSLAAGAPTVGLVYAPKVASLFALIGRPDLGVPMTREGLRELPAKVLDAWLRRVALRTSLAPRLEELRGRARSAAEQIAALL